MSSIHIQLIHRKPEDTHRAQGTDLKPQHSGIYLQGGDIQKTVLS